MRTALLFLVWYADQQLPNIRNQATIFAYFSHTFSLLQSLVYLFALNVQIFEWEVQEEPSVIEEPIVVVEPEVVEEVKPPTYCDLNPDDPACFF